MLDLSNDWDVLDNTESLTYTSHLTGQSFIVANASRCKVSLDFIQGRHFKDVELHGEMIVFNTWINQGYPQDFVPQMGDSFVDAEGYVWVVQGVEIASLRSRYRLACLEKK